MNEPEREETAMGSMALVVLPLLLAGLGFAQTAQEQARIDYEAAKQALNRGDFPFALEQFEGVMKVLGEQPELLVLAGESAVRTGDYEKAAAYVKKAFATADDRFRASPNYKRLVSVAAEIKTHEAKKWHRSVESLCSIEYFPVTQTYFRRMVGQYSSSTKHSTFEVIDRVTEVSANSVAISSTGKQMVPADTSKDHTSVEHYSCSGAGLSWAPGSKNVVTDGINIPNDPVKQRTWTTSSKVEGFSFTQTCALVGAERVVVPAGDFQTLKVECSGSSSSLKSTGKSTQIEFIASGVGVVKTLYKDEYFEGENKTSESLTTYELVEWKP